MLFDLGGGLDYAFSCTFALRKVLYLCSMVETTKGRRCPTKKTRKGNLEGMLITALRFVKNVFIENT